MSYSDMYGFYYKFIFIVLIACGAYLLYYKFVKEPALQHKENKLIEEGLAKERASYFLQQNHTYYSTNISNIDDIIANIDLDFLKSHTSATLWESVTPIIIKNSVIYYLRKFNSPEIGESWYIVGFSQDDVEEGFQYSLSILKYPSEHFNSAINGSAEIRWHYNLFVTHLEQVMKSLDANIEVTRHLQTFE